MRLRRVIHFKLSKSEALPNLFSKVIESLRGYGCPEPIIVFRMENMPGGRSNACARVVKAFPSMKCFQTTEVDRADQNERLYALTNRPSVTDATEGTPIQTADVDTLELICCGIPKSFPFFTAEFLFVAVPFLGDGAEGSPPFIADALSTTSDRLACADIPSVYLENGYSPSGRRCELRVTLEQPMPAFDLKKIPDFGRSSEFIASLGQVGLTRSDLVFSQEESKQIDSVSEHSQKFYADYENTIANHIDRISFPHNLPDTWEMGMSGFEKIGSLKEDLAEVFRKRGYRYQSKRSGRGEYCLQKRTDRGNVIELFVDTGFMSKNASASLRLSGLGLDCGFYPLPISAEVPSRNQYPILDLEHCRRIVENFAAVVDYLEKEIIPGIDELWGPCPLWYSRWS